MEYDMKNEANTVSPATALAMTEDATKVYVNNGHIKTRIDKEAMLLGLKDHQKTVFKDDMYAVTFERNILTFWR